MEEGLGGNVPFPVGIWGYTPAAFLKSSALNDQEIRPVNLQLKV